MKTSPEENMMVFRYFKVLKMIFLGKNEQNYSCGYRFFSITFLLFEVDKQIKMLELQEKNAEDLSHYENQFLSIKVIIILD